MKEFLSYEPEENKQLSSFENSTQEPQVRPAVYVSVPNLEEIRQNQEEVDEATVVYHSSSFKEETYLTQNDLEQYLKEHKFLRKPKTTGWMKFLVVILICTSVLLSLGLGYIFLDRQRWGSYPLVLPQHLSYPPNDATIPNYIPEDVHLKEGSLEKLYTPKDISNLASPAVVAIHTQTRVVNFFGQVGQREGAGSGVIIRPDGYIVTNNHVIAGATKLFVRLADGKEFPAKLIGTDKETDLAVIKIEKRDILHNEEDHSLEGEVHSEDAFFDNPSFPYLALADSSLASVGDQVVAIGNPLGEFAGSLTVGYISALDRSLSVKNEDRSTTTLVGLIQTDAAINRGNSGGALINLRGELLGINTVKSAAVGVEGLGFAIPSNTVKPIVEDLIAFGKIKARPIIGISGQMISEDIRESYGLPEGIWVREVIPNGPAMKAGIRPQDILVAVNGRKIRSVADLNAYKNTLKKGDLIIFTVFRQGQMIDIEVILDMATRSEQG